MPLKKELSLLPEEENINSFSARFVYWLTTVGRFVIVFTELIVILAFLSRFSLDRTNSDLSEAIRQQKAIVDSTANFEKDFLSLQKRLNIIRSFYDAEPDYQGKIKTITESTPPDITFNQLTLQRDKSKNITANIVLVAFRESSIVNFITNLSLNPQISLVNIQTIEKKPRDNKYYVEMSLSFAAKKS